MPYAALVLYQALADRAVAEFAAACLRPLLVFHPDFWVSIARRSVSVGEIMESLEAYSDELESYQAEAYQKRVEAALARRVSEPSRTDLGSTN